jgi:hypothetical protein
VSPVAHALRVVADELEAALREAAGEELNLREASRESGYSERRLRELVASGTIPNQGAKGRPRLRRSDLPSKPRKNGGAWDASEHVRAIAGGAS